ncbi:MAG: hypothetical protein QM757_15110 [Paludibaculum sp.]
MNRNTIRRSGSTFLLLALALAPQALPGASTPSISGYAPAATVSVVDLQTLTVYGSGFQRGLSVKLTDPSGRSSLLNSGRISQVSTNSFQLLTRFSAAGDYQIQVTNPDGGLSNQQKITVTAKPEPTITGTNPYSAMVDSKEQVLTVVGSGFRTGLTVYLSRPGGASELVQDLRITNLTANQFELHAVLDRVGRYELWLTDPDGVQSNSYAVAVTSSQSPVRLFSINPASPLVSSEVQVITVSGFAFQPGLAATITSPSAGTTVVAGPGRVRNVTSTNFLLTTTFLEPGDHTMQITNPDGGQSGVITFRVGDAGEMPAISMVQPAPILASPQSVTINVLGSGFEPGLNLSILRPDGSLSVFAAAQIFDLTSSSFSVVSSFSSPGDYVLQVQVPSTAKSKTYVLHVLALTNAPVILSYAPIGITAASVVQTVTVHGYNFKPGLKAVWLTSQGFTLPAPDIDPSTVSAIGFDAGGTFVSDGTYLLQVINPDGAKSDYFPIRVGTPGPSAPHISSHSPQPIAASGSIRSLLVQGGDFIYGMTATLIQPDSSPVIYTADQIQGVTFSSFVINAAFIQPGGYKLQVANPDGTLSNVYEFTVDVAPPSPVISSIAPTPIHVNVNGQTIVVNGGGFLPGLKARLIAHPPADSPIVVEVQPSQIQSVTPTSFLLTVTVSQAWTYDIQVDNPDGTQSNLFSFIPVEGISQPIISGYVPTPYFMLTGLNFQDDLSVTIWPGSGDIYQLTGLTPLCAIDESGLNRCTLQLPITLTATGTWRFRVFNPDGGQSSTFEIKY